jgi:hypothetical protein
MRCATSVNIATAFVAHIQGGSKLAQLQHPGLKRKKANEHAMERTGFRVSKWDQLNWFARFSQQPLDRLTASQLQDVQEEITAIVWETRRYWMDTLLNSQQIKELQGEIANHLVAFLESGHTEYGPLNSEYSVEVLEPADKSH